MDLNTQVATKEAVEKLADLVHGELNTKLGKTGLASTSGRNLVYQYFTSGSSNTKPIDGNTAVEITPKSRDTYFSARFADDIAKGETITVSFDVEYTGEDDGKWKWRMAWLSNAAEPSVWVTGHGHYKATGTVVQARSRDQIALVEDDGERTILPANKFVIRNIKIERGAVETGFCLADQEKYGVTSVYYEVPNNYTAFSTSATYVVGDKVSYGNRCYTCNTAVSTAGSWTGTTNWTQDAIPVFTISDARIASYFTGLTIALKFPFYGGDSGTAVNINGMGEKRLYRNNGAMTTHVGPGTVCIFVYDGTYFRWADYDSTSISRLQDAYYRPYAGSQITSYKLLMRGVDNRLYPLTTTSGDGTSKAVQTVALRPDDLWYYASTATVNAGAVITDGALYRALPNTAPKFTFNSDIPAYRDVYICGNFDYTTGLFTLATTTASGAASVTDFYRCLPNNSASVNYSDYFITGRHYIYVGATYSYANYFNLLFKPTIYVYDGTNLVPITSRAVADKDGNDISATYVKSDSLTYMTAVEVTAALALLT